MSTPYTLMRCGMKDLISCFNARKVVVEEDREEHVHRTVPEVPSNDTRERSKQPEHGVEKDDGVGQESPASWQSCESEEDEYIVFCFKDDEPGIDVIEERGGLKCSSRSQHGTTGEHNNEKELEIHEIQFDLKLIHSKTDERNELNKHECNELKDILSESSDSSTSSFAFPAIKREWTGSPVLMPRQEGNNKARSVCVQCCKF